MGVNAPTSRPRPTSRALLPTGQSWEGYIYSRTADDISGWRDQARARVRQQQTNLRPRVAHR